MGKVILLLRQLADEVEDLWVQYEQKEITSGEWVKAKQLLIEDYAKRIKSL